LEIVSGRRFLSDVVRELPPSAVPGSPARGARGGGEAGERLVAGAPAVGLGCWP